MAKRVKGTVDYFPETWGVLRSLLDTCQNVAERYNFSAVESPVMEELSLLTEKEGEETIEQIFILEKRSSETLGLRFDLTVPLSRMFIAEQKSVQKPVKWSYGTRMWRYERPQKGRLREFYQFGVELFGSPLAEADAEVINLAIDCLKDLGLGSKEVFVNVNNRKLLQGILESCAPKGTMNECLAVIDKREKIDEKQFHDMLSEIGVKDVDHLISILDLTSIDELNKLRLGPLAAEGLEELDSVMKRLDPKMTRISLSTVRGLAYYSGTVFEIFDTGNKYRSVCGGGRYDHMIKLFGGQDTPAVGFGMGMSTLHLVLSDAGKLPEFGQEVDYYVAIIDGSVREVAGSIISFLRKDNSVDYDMVGRSLSKQLGYAETLGAKKVIIVGPKDLEKKQVTLRDMETGKETTEKLSTFGL